MAFTWLCLEAGSCPVRLVATMHFGAGSCPVLCGYALWGYFLLLGHFTELENRGLCTDGYVIAGSPPLLPPQTWLWRDQTVWTVCFENQRLSDNRYLSVIDAYKVPEDERKMYEAVSRSDTTKKTDWVETSDPIITADAWLYNKWLC